MYFGLYLRCVCILFLYSIALAFLRKVVAGLWYDRQTLHMVILALLTSEMWGLWAKSGWFFSLVCGKWNYNLELFKKIKFLKTIIVILHVNGNTDGKRNKIHRKKLELFCFELFLKTKSWIKTFQISKIQHFNITEKLKKKTPNQPINFFSPLKM